MNNGNESKQTTPSRQGLYAYAAQYSKEAIDFLVNEMRNSHNSSVRMGAAKALLDKCLPDLKATELSGENGGAINVRLINDYISKPLVNATPEGSPAGSDEVQGTSVAPEGQENINSTGEDSAGSVQPAL